MIPAIGYMIGFYIITRMCQILFGQKDGRDSTVTFIFAAITILVAVLGLIGVFSSEMDIMNAFK